LAVVLNIASGKYWKDLLAFVHFLKKINCFAPNSLALLFFKKLKFLIKNQVRRSLTNLWHFQETSSITTRKGKTIMGNTITKSIICLLFLILLQVNIGKIY